MEQGGRCHTQAGRDLCVSLGLAAFSPVEPSCPGCVWGIWQEVYGPHSWVTANLDKEVIGKPRVQKMISVRIWKKNKKNS